MSKEKILKEILGLVGEYAAADTSNKNFDPGTSIIPPSGKVVGAGELKNMVEASLDGWLTAGRFNKQFEQKLQAFMGVKHLMTVNSGSSANLVAFSTLTSPELGERAIKPGDEVVILSGKAKDPNAKSKRKKVQPQKVLSIDPRRNTVLCFC